MTGSPDPCCAIVAIQQLKARYAAHADAKYGPGHHPAAAETLLAAAQGQAACFTEDACWAGGADYGGDIVGRAALARFFADPPWRWATHYYVSPLITVEGERAAASWRLWQAGIPAACGEPVFLMARTEERYRLTGDGWLHDHVRFTRIDRLHDPRGGLAIETIL